VLRGNLSLLGMVQHVVDYSYSHPDCRRRFTAISTARAMPAPVAEESLPGRALFGTLGFHLPSFFMTYAETGLRYENTAWRAMGEKNQGDESACASKTLSDKSCRNSPASSTIVKLQSKLGRTYTNVRYLEVEWKPKYCVDRISPEIKTELRQDKSHRCFFGDVYGLC
jgi:hypothetical protein